MGRRTFKRRQMHGAIAKPKVFTTFEVTDQWNDKHVFYGYSVGAPPTEPPRQDWPSTIFYQDSPRQQMSSFYATTAVVKLDMAAAGPSDRSTTFMNEQVIKTAFPNLDAYDFIYYLKPYYTHHRIYNPNNHAMWIKIHVMAQRVGKLPNDDPDTNIASYLGGQYRSMATVQCDMITGALSTSNIDWKNLDTTAGTVLGMQGLASLFDPQYEQGQVDAALQAGRESARESKAGQNAMYGAAGGLGSSRMALADRNLSSLNEQRQATAAANARAGVQANKAAAANQLATLGGQQISGANQAAAARIGYSQTPQDVLAKYASVIYGTPQQSTTPSFQGTQGQTTSGKSSGFKL